MALTFPDAADTPRKKLRFLIRAKRRLEKWHNDRSESLPVNPTPARIAAFKEWERSTWRPAYHRLATRIENRVATFKANNPDWNVEQNEDHPIHAFWESSEKETLYDADIDPEVI